MGWFRSDPPVVDFEAVIDTDGVTWQAFTDDDGVLVIDTDAEVEVFVNRAVVGGTCIRRGSTTTGAWSSKWTTDRLGARPVRGLSRQPLRQPRPASVPGYGLNGTRR
jgi:hypothetical protein